jgi:hypothetical protein
MVDVENNNDLVRHRINDSYYPNNEDEIEPVGSILLKEGVRKRTFAAEGEIDPKQV